MECCAECRGFASASSRPSLSRPPPPLLFFFPLLWEAGLQQASHGAESASPKVLKLMDKDFQKIETMLEAGRKCARAGIRPSFNIIFGFPGEGKAERQETIRFIRNACGSYPCAEFWTNIFTPYPGAPIMRRAAELGIDVPQTFEGWADFFPRLTAFLGSKAKSIAVSRSCGSSCELHLNEYQSLQSPQRFCQGGSSRD